MDRLHRPRRSVTGAGPGTVIARLLDVLLAAEAPAMIFDGTGEFLSQFLPGIPSATAAL